MGRNPPGMGNYIVTQLYPVKMNPSLRLGFQGKIKRWHFAHLYTVCEQVSCMTYKHGQLMGVGPPFMSRDNFRLE